MSETNAAAKRQLTMVEQIACAWPIALVAIGGAVGGACGGAAWAINTRIMRSNMAAPARYALVVLTGVGAIVAWLVAIYLLMQTFPTIFGPH